MLRTCLSFCFALISIGTCGKGICQDPHKAPARDPIIIPECRLTVIDKQEVPSQRDGILLVVGTELKPGQQAPADRLVRIKVGEQERTFRRLHEGDTVEAGQLVALLDDRVARDDWAIKKGQLAVHEADLSAAERIRDEAHQRYITQAKLRSSSGGPAASEEDVGGAKLLWSKNYYDVISKAKVLELDRLELRQAETLLGLYEMRTTIGGVVKRIHKKAGEAVRGLEPVLEVRNSSRLRVEGLVDVQHVASLRVATKCGVYTSEAQGPLQTFVGHQQEVTAVAIGRCPTLSVVSASADGTVRVWDRTSRQEMRLWRHPSAVKAIACSPASAKGNYCLVGTADGSVWLWNLDGNANQPERSWKGHQGAVGALAFTPNGTACVTGGEEDRTISLWDVETGTLRYRFPPAHLGAVTTLEFGSSRLISAGRDNTLRTWTVGEKEAKAEEVFPHRSGEVFRLGVWTDGTAVLFDQTNSLQILSVPGGRTRGILRNASGLTQFTAFAKVSSDGKMVITAGGTDGRLQLWRTPGADCRGYELRQLVTPDRSTPTCAAFAPDGSFLVTGSRDRQVMVWPLPSGEEVDRHLEAELTLVERAAESGGRQARIWAELSNPDGRLLPGMTVTLVVQPQN